MSQSVAKYTIDGHSFHSKSDVTYYEHLKQYQNQQIIDTFSLSYIEETAIHKRTGLPKIVYKLSIEIDTYIFHIKADADYYLHLKTHLTNGLIQHFSMAQTLNSDTKSKYQAKKVTVDGYLFDSKEEANYYLHLMEQKKGGTIRDFRVKPTYILQPAFKKHGKSFRRIDYTPDFEVYHWNNQTDVIDVKGMITPEFSLKRKLFEYAYEEKELKLMKYVQKYGGWVTFDEWKKLKK